MDDCTCLGHSQIFECVVYGGGLTIWQGTAFHCSGNQIQLRHSQYNNSLGAIGECNDGAIVASSVGVSGDHYTSQLNVTVGQEMINGTIECMHEDIQQNRTVGQKTLEITTGTISSLRM